MRQQALVTRHSSLETTFIGLFPWLGPGSVGGVQVSGQLAWEGLAPAAERGGARALRLSYGAPHGQAADAATLPAASRGAAVRAMLGQRGHAGVVLVWHVDFLKLLPFNTLRLNVGRLNVGRLNVQRSTFQPATALERRRTYQTTELVEDKRRWQSATRSSSSAAGPT